MKQQFYTKEGAVYCQWCDRPAELLPLLTSEDWYCAECDKLGVDFVLVPSDDDYDYTVPDDTDPMWLYVSDWTPVPRS